MLAMVALLFLLWGNAQQTAALLSFRRTGATEAPLPDRELPRYTAIVALHREHKVIPDLIKALVAIDYPVSKLDIRIVLEESDRATISALRLQALPANMRLLILPPGLVMTKPRAMNAALLLTEGDFVTIFDAEDEPQPDQLRKAAAVFAASPRKVACLQASLSPDNAGDGLMQALFTLEYAALFNVMKNGMCRLDHPIPLGGTSNHFRRDVLEKLGGWDAYNVTEDAELGLRLWLNGYETKTLDSETFEEAPPTLQAWFNQRRRWSKGWMQTVIAHARDRLPHAPGIERSRSAFSTLTMSTALAGMLIYPFGSVMFLLRFLLGPPFLVGDPVHDIVDIFAIMLVGLGVINMFGPVVLALRAPRLRHLAPVMLLMPLYSLAISLASWVALVDLIRAPFHWLKTEHGFARTSLRTRLRRQSHADDDHMQILSAAMAISAKTAPP